MTGEAAQASINGFASGSAQQQPEAAAAKGEPEGKRKRRPNVKYEGGEFMTDEEALLQKTTDGGLQLKDEPVDAVAQTLMHMSGGGMDPKQQQQQQQHQQAAAVANGQYMAQMAAMQQMQGGMMMHPAWAQMMMPGAAAMQSMPSMGMMDMSGQKQPDPSSMGMYAGMYAMMPHGYPAYTAPG